MTAKITRAERVGRNIEIDVLLDVTQVDDQGEPLPGMVHRFVWGTEPPEGVSQADYERSIRQEVRAKVKTRVQAMRPAQPVRLSLEGEEWDPEAETAPPMAPNPQ